jgi:L-fuconolactonase
MSHASWTRRQFLAAAALTPGCAVLDSDAVAAVDAHVHFYDPSRPQGVPWPPKNDTLLHRPYLPAELEALSRPLGVTGVLAVEASEWAEDNTWLLDLADRTSFILGVVANLPVGNHGFDEAFSACRGRAKFRGARIRPETMRAALAGGPATDHIRRLEREGLSIDVLIAPEDLPDVARFANAFKDLTVVVDHCGNVPVGPERAPNGWNSGMAACHYAPNVCMKFSGLVENAHGPGGGTPADPAFYRERFDTLYRVFGPERLIFATNWPVCLHFADYVTTTRIARSLLREKGDGLRSMLRRTAMRAYKLG